MAVVEYKNHVFSGDNRKHIPGFIKNPGHWFNKQDKTFIGWTPTDPDFYVPNTLKVLTKEDLVQRLLALHAIEPLTKLDSDQVNIIQVSDEEVQAYAEQWYDEFVAGCLAEEEEIERKKQERLQQIQEQTQQ